MFQIVTIHSYFHNTLLFLSSSNKSKFWKCSSDGF